MSGNNSSNNNNNSIPTPKSNFIQNINRLQTKSHLTNINNRLAAGLDSSSSSSSIPIPNRKITTASSGPTGAQNNPASATLHTPSHRPNNVSKGTVINNNNNTSKTQNRHTIAISNENYENLTSKLDDLNPKKLKNTNQNSFESNNNNSQSPLSKTPDSTNENWMSSAGGGGTINDSSSHFNINKNSSGDLSGYIGGSGTGSVGNFGTDSDHEMLESNATGLSAGSGLEGDESAGDDDFESCNDPSSMSPQYDTPNYRSLFNDGFDDQTSRRLKAFVTTTLYYEQLYLEKLNKLTQFKQYLDENLSGTQADISVIFTGIQQIKSIHEIIANKLQDYLKSLGDLLPTKRNAALASSPSNTRLNAVVGSSRQATNLSPTVSSNILVKETFLNNAIQVLSSIMEISFPVYLDFLKNYPKAMTILNKLEKSPNAASRSINIISKRKTFLDCQVDFNKQLLKESNESGAGKERKAGFLSKITRNKDPFNIYYNDGKRGEEKFDISRVFSEDILRRPTKLFEFTSELKTECMLASEDLPLNYRNNMQTNIKSLFENEGSKNLRNKVFDEINRNIMPIEVRKSEDVVELIENNNERKLRHLILYGDCLVCCRLKKDKRQLKWFIRIDQLEIFLDDHKSAKSELELKHLREEVASLRGNLKRQAEENASARNQQKIKKKLAEQENELTIQSSKLKMIIRENPSLNNSSPSSASLSVSTDKSTSSSSSNSTTLPSTGFFSPTTLSTAFSSSMNNLANLTNHQINKHNANANNHNVNNQQYNGALNSNSNNSFNNQSFLSSSSSSSSSNTFVFLFTSDFERNSWLEEINAAIYAYKNRNKPVDIQQSEIESRINSLKRIEEPPKVVTSSCTGSLELLVKHIEELSEPNKVFVAVELKSCGSYLQVAQTQCTELTSKPVWDEKFNLELQSVDSLRIILYSQTSSKALAIASQEIKIDSNANLNKIISAKLNNGMTLHISMKFLSPKKTITRRRTRNRNDIFGGNLSDLLQREKSTIPRILKDCVEIIETKGIEEVGIYRVSSVVSEVQKMKDLYSKSPNQALNELRQKSPHLSANLLKLYLRELPDPLFTSFLYHRFMGALGLLPEFRHVELCRVFNDLPESNKTIILFLLTHLLNIANHSDKNMMGMQNLCTLFGPTLMKLSPKDNLQVEDMSKEIKESMQQAQVLFYILQLHSEDKLITEANETSQTDQVSSKTPSNITIKTDNNDTSDNNNNRLAPKSLNDKQTLAATNAFKQLNIDNNNNLTTAAPVERTSKLSMQTAL